MARMRDGRVISPAASKAKIVAAAKHTEANSAKNTPTRIDYHPYAHPRQGRSKHRGLPDAPDGGLTGHDRPGLPPTTLDRLRGGLQAVVGPLGHSVRTVGSWKNVTAANCWAKKKGQNWPKP